MKNFKTTLCTGVALLALAALAAAPATADQVINDDCIVIGSQCIGIDCVNGMAFGFDTLVLQENNLRMFFNDTSTSASFPRNDWRFIANDSSNGGSSYLAIEDATAGRQVFRVDAGAPANSLRVDSGGDVGIGTANPVVDLHVKTGNTPTLRLEQDGTAGFAPQTFDVAGNEANFFIRDVTNGSTLPIRLRPGAPSSAIDIAANGAVGFGTSSPTVLGAEMSATMGEVSNGQPARLGFQTDGEDWALVALNGTAGTGAGQLIFATDTDPTGVLVLDPRGLDGGLGTNAGDALCVNIDNILCKCGQCP